MPPFPFMESRLVRDCDPDYMLRVCVRDDDDQQLTYTVCSTGSFASQRRFLEGVVKEPIVQGLVVGPVRYMLLGNSSSQMRDHGLVLYAKDSQGRTASYLRKAIGNLDQIRLVPKYIARVGQAFSSSMDFIEIEDDCQAFEADKIGGRHPETGEPYKFTDGCGQISVQLAKEICAKMNIRPLIPSLIPSAFQIRYKGAKGDCATELTTVTRRQLCRSGDCQSSHSFSSHRSPRFYDQV